MHFYFRNFYWIHWFNHTVLYIFISAFVRLINKKRFVFYLREPRIWWRKSLPPRGATIHHADAPSEWSPALARDLRRTTTTAAQRNHPHITSIRPSEAKLCHQCVVFLCPKPRSSSIRIYRIRFLSCYPSRYFVRVTRSIPCPKFHCEDIETLMFHYFGS